MHRSHGLNSRNRQCIPEIEGVSQKYCQSLSTRYCAKYPYMVKLTNNRGERCHASKNACRLVLRTLWSSVVYYVLSDWFTSYFICSQFLENVLLYLNSTYVYPHMYEHINYWMNRSLIGWLGWLSSWWESTANAMHRVDVAMHVCRCRRIQAPSNLFSVGILIYESGVKLYYSSRFRSINMFTRTKIHHK